MAHVSTLARCLLAALVLLGAVLPAGAHDMNKMWAEMRTRSVGMGIGIAADERGTLWLTRMKAGHLWVSRSNDGGRSFGTAVKVNAEPESILAEGQNRPRIAVRDGVVAVAWSEALPTLFAGNVRFSRSTDGGHSFSAPRTINENREAIGHSFVALSLGVEGRLALAWLDARDRVAAERAGRAYAGNAIYYALSENAGESFSPDRKLADHTCECCRLAIASDADNVAVVQWRHIFGKNERDFALARLVDKPLPVRASEEHWEIDACPHHGGDIAIGPKGRRHMVWFTGHPEKMGLYYRWMQDDQATPPQGFGNLDAQPSNPVVHVRDRIVHVAWREFDGQRYRLLFMRSNDAGDNWTPPHEVAASASQADLAQFPTGTTKPLLAWHTTTEGVRIFDLEALQ